MPARTAATRSYLDRVAGEDWPLTITVTGVDPLTGLVQAAFGAEATPDPLDVTGVHQIITAEAQTGHDGIITQTGTTADGNGTAILRFVIPGASVTAFTPTGMPYSVRTWESAESYWTEQVGWVSSVVPSSSLTGLLGDAVPDEVIDDDPGDIDLDVPIPVATLNLTPATATITGLVLTQQMTVELLGAGGEDIDETTRVIAYVSSAPAVATVNATGLVTRVGPGTTTITATSEGISDTATITVAPIVASGIVTPAAPEIENGATQAMAVAWTGDDGNPIVSTQTWSSSAPLVVSIVGATGVATGEADAGTATLTATAPNGITASTIATAVPATVSGVLDTFTREDTYDGLGTSDSGHTYTISNGAWGIIGGASYCHTPGAGYNVASVDIGSASSVKVDILESTASGPGVCVRYTNASNMIVADLLGGEARLIKVDAGVFTVHVSAVHAFTTGDTIEIRDTGTHVSLWVNDVQVGATIADTFNNTVTRSGFVNGSNAAPRYDNFVVTP